MREIWKDIKGYEGKYQVSNKGRVRSLMFVNNVTNKKRKEPKILKPTPHSNAKYKLLQVYLCNKGNKKQSKVHRLVAEAFIPNIHNYPVVNHIDSNTFNNNVDNLEWCTVKQNVEHAVKNGNFGAKLDSEELVRLYKTKGLKELEKMFKSSVMRIKKILLENGVKLRTPSECQRLYQEKINDK